MRYKLHFKDSYGEQATIIENDGRTLRMALRGMIFEGHDFDTLSLVEISNASRESADICLNRKMICNCEFACDIPLLAFRLNTPDKVSEFLLHIKIKLGKPTPIGYLDRLEIKITLNQDLNTLITPIYSHFEQGLKWLQTELLQLPAQLVMKICSNCDLSDYHPVGQSMFGSMGCFRAKKEDYRAVQSKDDILDIWTNDIPAVQETFVCNEFCLRTPGRGYRG